MAWQFIDNKPIFEQVMNRVTLDILRGHYQPGDKLETVRDLAVTAGVNPNTVQRALTAVEESGLIFTKRGDGRYVTDDPTVIAVAKEAYLCEQVDCAIKTLRTVGISDEEIKNAFILRLSPRGKDD